MTPSSLPVYNPLGGRFHLLHWWTYDERGHVVLARRESSLLTAVEILLDEHPDAEIKAYLGVELVAPSRRLCMIAAAAAMNREISIFLSELTHALSSALELGIALPAPFSLCTKYEPEEENGSDEWARERHYDCRNCKNTIALGGLSHGELYSRYHEGWRKLRPVTPHDDKRVASRAPAASDDEPLWYAYANFGHHAGGVELREVDFEYPPEDVLFFFRRLATFDVAVLNARFQNARAVLNARRERNEAARVAQRQEDERRRAEELAAFLQRGAP